MGLYTNQTGAFMHYKPPVKTMRGIRMSDKEWAIVVKGARKNGITPSAYVRLLIARDGK